MLEKIRKALSVYRHDAHLREVLTGTLLALILKVAGSALAFFFNVAVARLLGAEGAGVYFLSLSIVTIASVLARLGLDNALLRHISASVAHGQWGDVRGIYRLGMRLAIVSAVALTLLLYWLASWLAEVVFNEPVLAEPLQLMGLSILPLSLLHLHAESLKGVKRIGAALTIQSLGLPLLMLLLLFPLVDMAGLSGVATAYLLSTVLVAMLAVTLWRRRIPADEQAEHGITLSKLWDSCRRLFVISLIGSALMPFAPILLLGALADSAEVGIYGAANQVAMLVSFLLVVANNAVAPKFAELYAKGDMASLSVTARKSAMLMTVLVLPFFIILLLSSRWVMGVFGPEFEEGAVILIILTCGQMLNLVTGSAGYLLMMSGNEQSMMHITLVSALSMLFISLLLIPTWGGVGAAVASAVAVAVLKFGALWQVRMRMGFIAVGLERG